MCAAAATAHTDAGCWAIIYEIKLVIWKLKLGACNNKITSGHRTGDSTIWGHSLANMHRNLNTIPYKFNLNCKDYLDF